MKSPSQGDRYRRLLGNNIRVRRSRGGLLGRHVPGQSAIYSLITRQPGPQICQRMPYITRYPILLEISSKTPTISNLSYLFDKLT